MFTNVGWSELLVLGVVALVVLGPERLPEAARWLVSAIRKVKEFAGNAQQQLKDDYGADFDEFKEPLQQLNELRGLSPRAMVTKHLLDGDDSLFSGNFDAAAPAGGAVAAGPAVTGPATTGPSATGSTSGTAQRPTKPQSASGTSSTAAPAPSSPSGATNWDDAT